MREQHVFDAQRCDQPFGTALRQILHNLKAPTGAWQLVNEKGQPEVVQVRGTVTSNIGESLLHLARRHHGISMHPRYMVADAIAEGRLEIVLPQYQCEGLDIYAIVQSRRYLPYKVRLFVDHLRTRFRDSDWTMKSGLS